MKYIYIFITFICCFAAKANNYSSIDNNLAERLNISESFKQHLSNTMRVTALHLIDKKFVQPSELVVLNEAIATSITKFKISRFKLFLDFPELNNFSPEELQNIAEKTIAIPSPLADFYTTKFACILKALRGWAVCAIGTIPIFVAGAWTACMVAAVGVDIVSAIFLPELAPAIFAAFLLESRMCYTAATAIESLTFVNVGGACAVATLAYIEGTCLQ